MTKALLPLAAAMLMFATQPALAAGAIGNPTAGKKKAEEVCAACHGVDGIGTDPQYPKLAGQHAAYLLRALKDYANGKRTNPIMMGFAATLTPADRENLAAWYSKQPGGLHTLEYDK